MNKYRILDTRSDLITQSVVMRPVRNATKIELDRVTGVDLTQGVYIVYSYVDGDTVVDTFNSDQYELTQT